MITVTGTVQTFPAPAGWHYIDVPPALIVGIRGGAYGMVPIECQLGATRWKTSLLPKGDGQYFIALKATVRKKEQVALGDTVTITFWLA